MQTHVTWWEFISESNCHLNSNEFNSIYPFATSKIIVNFIFNRQNFIDEQFLNKKYKELLDRYNERQSDKNTLTNLKSTPNNTLNHPLRYNN
jgi:hypothetical protein